MKLILFFVAFLCGLQPGFSEDSGHTDADDPQVYTLEFRMMSWSGGIWDLYLQPGEPSAKVDYFTVPSHRPSDWFKYTGTLPLKIYKKGEIQPVPVDRSEEEMEEVPRPVSSLHPETSGKWLFLLNKTQDENGDLYYQSIAVKDESGDFEKGCLVINLSPSELEVQMNDELHKLPPGTRHHFVAAPYDDGTVDLRIAEMHNDKLKQVNSNTILLSEQGLTTFLLSKTGNKVEVRRFVDPGAPERP
jgi:hypothetical protein